jgi:hypothetical protein
MQKPLQFGEISRSSFFHMMLDDRPPVFNRIEVRAVRWPVDRFGDMTTQKFLRYLAGMLRIVVLLEPPPSFKLLVSTREEMIL